MLDAVICIVILVFCVKCTDNMFDDKDVQYQCKNGKTYFLEGGAWIESTKYKDKTCIDNDNPKTEELLNNQDKHE